MNPQWTLHLDIYHQVKLTFKLEANAMISVYLCVIFIEPFNLNVNDSGAVCFGIAVVRLYLAIQLNVRLIYWTYQ